MLDLTVKTLYSFAVNANAFTARQLDVMTSMMSTTSHAKSEQKPLWQIWVGVYRTCRCSGCRAMDLPRCLISELHAKVIAKLEVADHEHP